MNRTILALALTVCLSMTGFADEQKGKAIAFIVGVDAQEDEENIKPLPQCGYDVDTLAEILKSKCGFEQTTILRDSSKLSQKFRPRRQNILDALAGLANNLEEKDTLLIYFSGHGEIRAKRKGPGETTYLVTLDTKAAELEKTAICADDLNDCLKDCKVAKVIVIIDACHAGGTLKSTAKLLPGAKVQNATLKDAASHLKFAGKGIQQQIVITSCSGTEKSAAFNGHADATFGDRKWVDGSLFTQCLVERLEQMDRQQVSQAKLGELFGAVEKRTIAVSKDFFKNDVVQKQQTPLLTVIKGDRAAVLDAPLFASVAIAPPPPPSGGAVPQDRRTSFVVKQGNLTLPFHWVEDKSQKAGGFWIAETEVSQALYKALMDGKNPSLFRKKKVQDGKLVFDYPSVTADYTPQFGHFKDKIEVATGLLVECHDDLPVEHVPYEDAKEFCRRLSKSDAPHGVTFRVPTATEWGFILSQIQEQYQKPGASNRLLPSDDYFDGPTRVPLLTSRGKLGRFLQGWKEGESVFGEASLPGTQKPILHLVGNVAEWCDQDGQGVQLGGHVRIKSGALIEHFDSLKQDRSGLEKKLAEKYGDETDPDKVVVRFTNEDEEYRESVGKNSPGLVGIRVVAVWNPSTAR